LTLDPLEQLYVLVGSRVADGLLESSSSFPDEKGLAGLDALMIYVDAGSRAPASVPEGYVIKLAILSRRQRQGNVVERVSHPKLGVASRGGGFQLVPSIFIGRGRARTRQAASYVAEVVSLLAAALGGSRALAPPGDWEHEFGNLVLVRHGPLLHLLQVHLGSGYNVERDEAERLLEYAGLNPGTAAGDAAVEAELLKARDELIKSSIDCNNKNMVNLGLIALKALDMLAEDTESNQGLAVLGVVEDTGESRLFAAATLAQVLDKARRALSQGGSISNIVAELKRYTMIGFNKPVNGVALSSRIEKGLGISSQDQYSRIAYGGLNSLVEAVRSTLITKLGTSLEKANMEDLEAAVLLNASMLPITDGELVYTLYYLGIGPSDAYPATRPRNLKGRLRMLEAQAESSPSTKCHNWVKNAVKRLRDKLRYRYAAPWRSPSLDDLENAIARKSLGNKVRPADIVSQVAVPPVMRIEYIDNGSALLKAAQTHIVYSSAVTLYGYPPQLLVVDVFSRIGAVEAAVFEPLFEQLQQRLRPYTFYLHGWENRIAQTT